MAFVSPYNSRQLSIVVSCWLIQACFSTSKLMGVLLGVIFWGPHNGGFPPGFPLTQANSRYPHKKTHPFASQDEP